MTNDLHNTLQIMTVEWKEDDAGRHQVVARRLIRDVAKDLEKSLEKHGVEFEYVSTCGAKEDARWPEGETFVSLEMGGSEGYALYVNVHIDQYPNPTNGVLTMYRPLRVKMLSGRLEALAVHALLFHLLGS